MFSKSIKGTTLLLATLVAAPSLATTAVGNGFVAPATPESTPGTPDVTDPQAGEIVYGVTSQNLFYFDNSGASFPLGSGTIVNASNLGAGDGVFAQTNGDLLEFKSLKAGTNITLTPSATELEISATGGAPANNAVSSGSNVVKIAKGKINGTDTGSFCGPGVQTGSWMSGCSKNSTGSYTLSFVAGTFTEEPICTFQVEHNSDSGGLRIVTKDFSNSDATKVSFTFEFVGNTSVNSGLRELSSAYKIGVVCIGE